MSDLLSQDEIDALLHGVDDVEEEDVVEDFAQSEAGTSDYDFSSQDRIVRGRMPTLEMVNERFARHMRISLFNMMRRTAEVSINGIQMIKFGEYVHTWSLIGGDVCIQVHLEWKIRRSTHIHVCEQWTLSIENTIWLSNVIVLTRM